MLIIIGTAGSREKNIVSGTTPAVNNNPTITSTTFSARSRFMVPSCQRTAEESSVYVLLVPDHNGECYVGQRETSIAGYEHKRGRLLQLRVLGFGLLQDGDVAIGIFPESEEVFVSGERPHAGSISISALRSFRLQPV